jgi:hypothetical protein
MQRQLSISSMPKLLPEEGGLGDDDDDVEAKPEKAPAPRLSGKERSVHLIPLIVVLCFLLLFLCSHDPSPSGTCVYLFLHRCASSCFISVHNLLFLVFRYLEFWEEGWEREGKVALTVGTTTEQVNDAARTFEIFAFLFSVSLFIQIVYLMFSPQIRSINTDLYGACPCQ